MKVHKTIKLILSKTQSARLLQISEAAEPNESAALLFGSVTREQDFVLYKCEKVQDVESSVPSPVSFLIGDIENLYSLWADAQSKGYRLVSIFHSHPSGAWPSGKDRKYMKNIGRFYRGIIWSIYGNSQDELNAFVYDRNRMFQVEIVI